MVLHSAKGIFPLAVMSSFLSFLQYSSQIMPNSPSSPAPPSPAFHYMSPNDPHLHNTSLLSPNSLSLAAAGPRATVPSAPSHALHFSFHVSCWGLNKGQPVAVSALEPLALGLPR